MELAKKPREVFYFPFFPARNKGKDHVETILKDTDWIKLLEKGDQDLADEVQVGGCKYCGAKLYCCNFSRKPRGVAFWGWRYSFDCSQCRRRNTPVSIRFLGRRVYAGVVVVLVSAMQNGLNERRVEALRKELKIDVRTLRRWREWWLGEFVRSPFWKAARARFMPLLRATDMPLSLVDRFSATGCEGLVRLMRFLAPITIGSDNWGLGM